MTPPETPTTDWPEKRTSRKVSGARAGAGIGAAIALVIGFVLEETLGRTVDDDVLDAIALLLLVGVPFFTSWIGGYYTRERASVIADVREAPPHPPRAEHPSEGPLDR